MNKATRPGLLVLLKQIPARVKAHNIMVTAAGIAFYGLLALVPTLIATVSIYGLINQGNEEQIKQQIEDAAGSLDTSTKEFVQGQLTSITSSDGNLAALILGIVLALFSASGAVQKLMATISVAYEAVESRAGWKVRILAYAMTVGAIVGVVAMVTVVGVVPVVLDTVDLAGPAEAAIRILQLPAFALLFVFGLTVLYRYGPDRSPRTPWRNPGAWVAAAIWVLFAVLFSLYSSNIGAMPASYGLLGTVAALMIFLQLTALAVIIGAEYNALAEEHRHAGAGTGVAAGTGAGAAARAGLLSGNGEAASNGSREPIGFAKAAAGLVALFVLGRGAGDGEGSLGSTRWSDGAV